jgi:hypothetical protein
MLFKKILKYLETFYITLNDFGLICIKDIFFVKLCNSTSNNKKSFYTLLLLLVQ